MSTTKESVNDQDPDYVQSVSNDEDQQKIYEEHARTNTAKKITAIIEKEFSQEIDSKEKEVLEIQEKLHKALKTLHFLRYVIITNFYNRKKCQAPQTAETKQTRIHPGVKQLLGKSPKGFQSNLAIPSTSTDPRFLNSSEDFSVSASTLINSVLPETEQRVESATESPILTQFGKRSSEDDGTRPKKIPRYIPPKNKIPDLPCPSRGMQHKVRKRIVVGNISKWIPPDWREDAASHKWTMYVRGSKEDSDIGEFVSKVRFFLHPSYRPNDVVEVTSSPFHLSRRGWGEFPVRVQLHFKSSLNKPMDIIHHLKLDRTYTGLQTLGSETLVDVWIYTTELRTFDRNDTEIDLKENSEESISKDSSLTSIPTGRKNKEECNIVMIKTEKNDTEISNEIQNNSEIELNSVKNEPEDENSNSSSFYLLSCNKVKPDDDSITSLTIEQLRTYVSFDHDYLSHRNENDQISNKTLQIKETNITIDHSITDKDSLPSQEVNIPEKYNNTVLNDIQNDLEKSDTLVSVPNEPPNNLNKINISAPPLTQTIKTDLSKNGLLFQTLENHDDSKLVNGLQGKINDGVSNSSIVQKSQVENAKVKFKLTDHSDLQKPSISQMPNLRPLQITIPAPFESTTGKRVLLLKNDKLISVDVANAYQKEISCNNKIKVPLQNTNQLKTIVPIGRGVSVLKRSQINSVQLNPSKERTKNAATCSNLLKIKPSGSLLLNVNCNIPALQIAHGYSLVNLKNNATKENVAKEIKLENQEEKKLRVTLGKDKYKIQSKKDFYKETLSSIDLANISDIEGFIRFIIRRLPIVTEHAADPEYKQLHPYSCVDEKEFFSYNIGKQRALEWCRAKKIRSFLQKKSFSIEKLWSVKEIMMWARLHGYTPVCTSFGIGKNITLNGAKKLPGSASSGNIITCTEPVDFQKWLRSCREKLENESSIDTNRCKAQDEEIDIIKVDQPVKNIRKELPCRQEDEILLSSSKPIPLEFDEKLVPLHDFVCETARDIGIKLGPEQITPNVIHCAAGRILTRMLECLVEDLVRSSYARAWERNNGNESPKLLTVDDVRGAIASREEFDIFTNEGLGSRQSLETD